MTEYPKVSERFSSRVNHSTWKSKLKMFLITVACVFLIVSFFWGEFGFFRMWYLVQKDRSNLERYRGPQGSTKRFVVGNRQDAKRSPVYQTLRSGNLWICPARSEDNPVCARRFNRRRQGYRSSQRADGK